MELYKFDPVIYPYRFWVAVGGKPTEIEDAFLDYDGAPIENLTSTTEDFEAYAMDVVDKVSRERGTLVHFASKKRMDYDVVAHECMHATSNLCDAMGIDITQREAPEFIIGWMAKCCEEVKKNKAKKDASKEEV